MTLARWPNEGEWAQIAGFPEASAQDDGHGGRSASWKTGFTTHGDRPAAGRTRAICGCTATGRGIGPIRTNGSPRWIAKQRLIKTAPPHGLYGFRKGQRFYFLNVLEELDQPGEWFLDRKAGMLYFWPPAGPSEAAATVAVAARPAAAAAHRRLARHASRA